MNNTTPLKIVIIGGTGLIGKKLGSILSAEGHNVLAASPSTGVNAITGDGLESALAGANILFDVSNSPSWEAEAVRDFFLTSTTHLIAAAKQANISHYIALSVVGADRLPSSGYMRAKLAQEQLIASSGLPYTILRATQFFEFISFLINAFSDGQSVNLPPGDMQPVAAADVAATLAKIATAEPANKTLDLAGPEVATVEAFAAGQLSYTNDPRKTTTNHNTDYFGASILNHELIPLAESIKAPTTFAAWLKSLSS